MEKNKKFIIAIISIITILGILGFSYEYFVIKIEVNNEAPIESIKTANLSLYYEDKDPTINLTNAKPGDVITKTFTVTNKSNLDLKYNISWEEIVNEYNTKNEIVYKIESNDGGANIEEKTSPTTNSLITNNIPITAGATHTYTLTFEYQNIENNDIENMGKYFSGKIIINEFNNEYLINKEEVIGGSLNVVNIANEGHSVTINSQPTENYEYGGAIIKNAETDEIYTTLNANIKTFTMPNFNVIITPKWNYLYKITNETITGGNINVKEKAIKGETVTIAELATTDYEYGGVVIKNTETDEIYLTLNVSTKTFIMPEYDITITSIWNYKYSITNQSVTGGSISVISKSISGQNITITTTPGTGYSYGGATIKNTSSGATYTTLNSSTKTFKMPEYNITIIPIWTANTYTVTRASVTGGSITGAASGTYGSTYTITATPSTGYSYGGATIKNTSTGATYTTLNASTKTFTIPAYNVTITPIWTANTYTVTRTAITGGSISGNASGTYGSTYIVTTSPTSGFTYQGATVKNTSTGAVYANLNASTKTFTMPAYNVTVSPIWKYNDTTVFWGNSSSIGGWQSSLYDVYNVNSFYASNQTVVFDKNSPINARKQMISNYVINATHYATFNVTFWVCNAYVTLTLPATMYVGLTGGHSWVHESAYVNSAYKAWNNGGNVSVNITNATGNWYLAIEFLQMDLQSYCNYADTASLYGRTYS